MKVHSMRGFVWVLLGGVSLAAQTLVDLQTQSKSVNFQNAQSTKPFKTGAVLPTVCAQGEMFFLTSAAAGANVYGCNASHTWAPQGVGGSGVTVDNTGVVVGLRPILDFTSGPGLLLATSDSGTAISIQNTLDTSVSVTKESEQSGAALVCSSSSNSATAYTCSMLPALTMYTTGMILRWIPDINGSAGSITLNVDGLGAVAVKLANGSTDPGSAEVVAGRMRQVWYDGAVFRFLDLATPPGLLGEARLTCDLTVRGRLWFVAGGSMVQDSLAVCAKDGAGVYAWRTLY